MVLVVTWTPLPPGRTTTEAVPIRLIVFSRLVAEGPTARLFDMTMLMLRDPRTLVLLDLVVMVIKFSVPVGLVVPLRLLRTPVAWLRVLTLTPRTKILQTRLSRSTRLSIRPGAPERMRTPQLGQVFMSSL